jgi:hypothetical protein
MERREFLILGAALTAAPSPAAAGAGHVEYSPAAYSAALSSGEPFLLDFYASW